MSKNPMNPFFETDFTKMMDFSKFMDMSKMMDMSKFMDMSKMGQMGQMPDMTKMMPDMTKMMDGCKCPNMPNMDVESMMATQRKNVEAVASASQKAFESMQSYMRRQAELARESFDATTKLVQEVMVAPSPEEKVAKQVAATKSTIEGCVSSLKELSDLLSQAQMQTVQTVSNRMVESMDEMQKIMKTGKGE